MSFLDLAPEVGAASAPGDLSQIILVIFRVVMILFWVILPLYLIVILINKDARKSFLRGMAFLVPVLIFLYFLSNQKPSQDVAKDFSPRLYGGQNMDTLQITPAPPAPDFVPPPAWVTTAVVVGIAVAIAVITAGVLFFFWRRSKNQQKDALSVVRREAQAALEDIQAGFDLRDAILRCYSQMVQALREFRGIDREQGMTPHEFEAFLQKRGLPAAPIHELTLLFEKVRYGGEKPGVQDEQTAIRSLTAIIQACQRTGNE